MDRSSTAEEDVNLFNQPKKVEPNVNNETLTFLYVCVLYRSACNCPIASLDDFSPSIDSNIYNNNILI